ncbi:MAG: hypothetical protein JO352_22120 [Chloroflexi bacterium]|nr:hypothetical protein [Chloroflexota bacterium]
MGALALVIGCQVAAPAPAAPPTRPPASTLAAAGRVFEWDATDYAFTTSDTLPAGLVTIGLSNHGQEPHQGQLLRLNDGVSFEQFTAALQQQGEGAFQLASAEGGPAAIDPHGNQSITLDLQPGSYVLLCLIPSPDGVPHFVKGMLKPLQVIDNGAAAVAPPRTQGTFTLKDFGFEIPDTLPAGQATYRVTNAGPQIHELGIVRLAPGKVAEDVQAWYKAPSGPPPFEAVGGMSGLSANHSGYVTLDLQPGSYAAECLVPDPASGVPHLHLGMVKAFTVR